jgi:hypothetical protein
MWRFLAPLVTRVTEAHLSAVSSLEKSGATTAAAATAIAAAIEHIQQRLDGIESRLDDMPTKRR